ncbi:MAG TPA: DNA polymerase III subunit beta, partial [Thermodesulfovibrionales bacterium]|nr:DNA polymerase III subunit beta [Thermodesulfovibrionales bacterium]
KRNTMPILSHFLLDASKGGSSITATDLETALREPLSAKVEKEGRICVPARKMFEIVREVEGDIICESVDDQWLKIKAGASSFRLACLSAKEFPAWPGMEDMEEITIPAETLADLIEKTVYSAGDSDTRYTLNGLLFHVMPGGSLSAVGTDGHRLATITKKIEGKIVEEKKMIVPKKAAAELRKVLDKIDVTIRMTLSKNHVLFTIGDIQFLTRLIEGTYPNYEQVIPSSNDKRMIVDRAAFARALRRVSVMAKDKTNAVKMEVDTGRIAVASSNPDMGEAADELTAEYTGEKMVLGLNARYLIDIIDVMSSEKVMVDMQGALNPVLIRDEGDPDYRCVIMPMRI